MEETAALVEAFTSLHCDLSNHTLATSNNAGKPRLDIGCAHDPRGAFYINALGRSAPALGHMRARIESGPLIFVQDVLQSAQYAVSPNTPER